MFTHFGSESNGAPKSAFTPTNKMHDTKPNSSAKKGGTDPYDMDKGAWRRVYGTKMDGGTKTELCWFFSNVTKGCTRKVCDYEHSLPDKYGSKKFHELDEKEKLDIIRTSQ